VAKVSIYQTREQGTAYLQRTGCTPKGAAALLDRALAMYPQSVRTNVEMITGYRAGTIMDAYYPGNPGIPADLFTIAQW
jgi:hypothetical protein